LLAVDGLIVDDAEISTALLARGLQNCDCGHFSAVVEFNDPSRLLKAREELQMSVTDICILSADVFAELVEHKVRCPFRGFNGTHIYVVWLSGLII